MVEQVVGQVGASGGFGVDGVVLGGRELKRDWKDGADNSGT